MTEANKKNSKEAVTPGVLLKVKPQTDHVLIPPKNYEQTDNGSEYDYLNPDYLLVVKVDKFMFDNDNDSRYYYKLTVMYYEKLYVVNWRTTRDGMQIVSELITMDKLKRNIAEIVDV